MFATGIVRLSRAYLARLGRWPRRLAVLACLLLAAGSALRSRADPPAGATSPHPASANPIARRLGPDQVAASVTVSGGVASGFLRVGDRVDLYAAADSLAANPACSQTSVVAGSVPVLALANRTDVATGARLVVAVDRPTAARLAALHGCDLLAVLDADP